MAWSSAQGLTRCWPGFFPSGGLISEACVSLLTRTQYCPSVTGLMVTSIFRISKRRESEFTSKMESHRLYHGQESGVCHHCRQLWVRSPSRVLLWEAGRGFHKGVSTRPRASMGLSATIHPLAFIIQTHSAAPGGSQDSYLS